MTLAKEEFVLERVLVFMASTRTHNVRYYLPEKPAEEDMVWSTVTPAALIQLQARHHAIPPPTKVIALVTEQASKGREGIGNAFVVDGDALPITWIEIPDGGSTEELMDIVQKLLDAIPQRCRLVVDITHGFRPGPFVFSVAIQYLALLNPEVEVEGLYYGMAKPPEPTAIVDMKVYLDMLDWLYGARVFRDTFIPNQLVQKMDSVRKEIGVQAREVPAIEALRWFAAATDAALPVEMAEHGLALGKALSDEVPERLRERIPVAERLFDAVTRVANEFIPEDREVPKLLSDAELDRQAVVIDKLLEHGRTVQAVGLMREWCYFQVMRHNPGGTMRWRTREEQFRVENLVKDGEFADPKIRGLFAKTRDLRNSLHHYGTSNGKSIDLKNLFSTVKSLWTQLKAVGNDASAWYVKV